MRESCTHAASISSIISAQRRRRIDVEVSGMVLRARDEISDRSIDQRSQVWATLSYYDIHTISTICVAGIEFTVNRVVSHMKKIY